MLYDLLENLSIENEVNRILIKCNDLKSYEKNEIEELKSEIKNLRRKIVENLNSTETEKFLNQLEFAEIKLNSNLYEKEKWKIDNFYISILISWLIGLGFGSLATKAVLDYDLEKFTKYLESNLRKED